MYYCCVSEKKKMMIVKGRGNNNNYTDGQAIDSGAVNSMNLDQLVLYGVNSARDVG